MADKVNEPEKTEKAEKPDNTVKVGCNMDKEVHTNLRIFCFKKHCTIGEAIGMVLTGFQKLPEKEQQKILAL